MDTFCIDLAHFPNEGNYMLKYSQHYDLLLLTYIFAFIYIYICSVILLIVLLIPLHNIAAFINICLFLNKCC